MKLVYNDTSHSYWLDGKRVKSATKVAQIAADSFTVEQWQKRQVAIGMTLDPSLMEDVAVDLENREAIQLVCEKAADIAKANGRARRGSQRHRVLELGLLGRQDQFITEQQIADWKVLERTLDAYGMTPIVDRVEQFIAWPDNGVVGRYDCYLNYRGVPSLVDLKGGENAVKYPHSTGVQLWLYRFAPQTSKAIVRNGDKSEVTEWTTAPDGADADSAYVIYCDDHHDVGELWRIDLNAARSGGELALGIVEWRKSYNYGKELAKPVSAPKNGVVPERTNGDAATEGSERAADATTAPPGVRIPPTPLDPTYNIRRARLLERYRSMSDAEKMAYCDLHIDGNNLDKVEAGLEKVDRFNVVVDQPVRFKSMWKDPLPIPPDEGGPVSDADVKALQQRYETLPLEASLWTGRLVAEGKQHHDFRIKDRPTVRRYELYRGILALAELGTMFDDDDVVRGLLYSATGREEVAQETLTLGAALSTLDATEAAAFATTARQYCELKIAR